jgi:hypothetical protein
VTGRAPIKERWAVDPDTGCWNWLLKVGDHGYGDTWDGSSVRKAHRVVYERLVGPVPDGLQLDHLCRNRACVNPDHLEPVTRSVNVQRGALAKVDPGTVIEIRARYAAGGITKPQLGAEYGVSKHTITDIVLRRSWRNIPTPARSAA